MQSTSTKQKASQANKAMTNEEKAFERRAKGQSSCRECRRLKLKCDKAIPCGSCKRRGCAAICPNGSLVTGEGTRFVLADTEKLHQKIARMSDRIRQLEDALTILQSTVSSEPHPLLDRELLKIKSSVELHAAANRDEVPLSQEEDSQYIDAFGTLAIRDDGAATFYGRSAGSESLLIGESTNQAQSRDSSLSQLPAPVTNLSESFPWAASQTGIDVDYLLDYLPPLDEAYRLSELYLEQAPWFFGAVKKRQIVEEILPMWYEDAAQVLHSPVVQSPGSMSLSGIQTAAFHKGGGHDLALLFVIFCFGALTDMNLPPAPDNALADRYYSLTKAALTIEPVLERPPSVATVQTLSLMAIYEGLKSGENSIESTWALMGIATKLAQSIGLHRDCARWKLSVPEVQKRRALYHELAITDCWQSLATGRLPTFTLPFVDCELPLDTEQTMADDGSIQPSFSYWKARFGAECVSAVVQGTLTSHAPKYSVILDLDRKVRDVELPKYAQGPPPQGLPLAQTMSHFMPTNYRELTLLYIHRCFFAHAIRTQSDPLTSPYAPSFLAGYRSSCDLLGSVKQQFSLFPAQIARFWVLWTHAFSASVMISSVVTNASKSKVAPVALLELKGACDLFEKAAPYGGRAVKFLPIVRRLLAKAQKVYYDTSNGMPPSIPNDIFRPSDMDESDDELAIFSGKTHTVTTSLQKPAHHHSNPGSRSPSDSPPQTTSNPAFAGVHPSLITALNSFEGQINAQLQKAYQSDYEGFTRTLMGLQPPPTQNRELQSGLSLNTSQPQKENHHQHTGHGVQHHPEPNHQYHPHSQFRPQNGHSQYASQAYSSIAHGVTTPASAHPHSQSQHRLTHSPSFTEHHFASREQIRSQSQSQQDVYSISTYAPSQHSLSSPVSHPSPASSIQSPTATHYTEGNYSSQARVQPTTTTNWSSAEMGNAQTESPVRLNYNNQMYYQHGLHPAPQHHYNLNNGMAAEDHSLQETWQNYMHKVGSPPLMYDE